MIHWGTKTLRKQMGRVADFCPICRNAAPFRFVSIRVQNHVQGIGIGAGKEKLQETTCEVCGVVRVHPAGVFTTASRVRDRHTLLELIEWTRPNLLGEYAQRFAMEERLKAGTLTPGERFGLLQEAFGAIGYTLASRGGNILGDWVLVVLGVLFFGLIGWAIVLLQAIKPDPVWMWLMAGGAASFVGMLYRAATWKGRVVRTVVEPLLVQALRPLDPSREEMEVALSGAGIDVAKRVNLERLEQRLRL